MTSPLLSFPLFTVLIALDAHIDIDVLKQWPWKIFHKSVECSKSLGCFYREEEYSPVLNTTAPVSDVLEIFSVRLQAVVSHGTKHSVISYHIIKSTHEGL